MKIRNKTDNKQNESDEKVEAINNVRNKYKKPMFHPSGKIEIEISSDSRNSSKSGKSNGPVFFIKNNGGKKERKNVPNLRKNFERELTPSSDSNNNLSRKSSRSKHLGETLKLNPKKDVVGYRTIDQESSFSMQTNQEEQEVPFLRHHGEGFDSSAAVSSFSKAQHEGKSSEVSDLFLLNKDSDNLNINSNHTTITSNINEVTREKKFEVKQSKVKKYVIKSNNGKFMLSKKMLNLGSKRFYSNVHINKNILNEILVIIVIFRNNW